MKLLKILVVAGLMLTSFSMIHAVNQQMASNFEKANEFYNQAIYDSALIQYHSILDAGYTSDKLLYNLGNTYFKLKDLPHAILYYEKALKLNPSDENILHNLSIANSMIVDKIEPMPEIFFVVWWRTFYSLLPADTWAWISIIFFGLSLLLVYFYLTSYKVAVRKLSFFTALMMVFLFVGSFGLASQKYYYTQQINEAIVFVPTITIKSSPSASSVDLFVLHEGTKVTLMDETADWQQIRIANGSIGWLPSDVIKGI